MLDYLTSWVLIAQTNLAAGGGDAAAVASEGAAGGQAPMAGGDGWTTMIFLVGMILVFWLMIFRPQQKERKRHKALLSELKRGDSVITASGIYGKIVGVAENVATLEIAKDVRVKILKSQIQSKAAPQDEGGAAKDKDVVEKS